LHIYVPPEAAFLMTVALSKDQASGKLEVNENYLSFFWPNCQWFNLKLPLCLINFLKIPVKRIRPY
jgi:hypothetical protein